MDTSSPPAGASISIFDRLEHLYVSIQNCLDFYNLARESDPKPIAERIVAVQAIVDRFDWLRSHMRGATWPCIDPLDFPLLSDPFASVSRIAGITQKDITAATGFCLESSHEAISAWMNCVLDASLRVKSTWPSSVGQSIVPPNHRLAWRRSMRFAMKRVNPLFDVKATWQLLDREIAAFRDNPIYIELLTTEDVVHPEIKFGLLGKPRQMPTSVGEWVSVGQGGSVVRVAGQHDDPLPPDGDWLDPGCSLAEMARRCDMKRKPFLKIYRRRCRVRRYPGGSREVWTIDLNMVPPKVREKLKTKMP